ncbi:MAG: hypothetical protein ACFB9M_16610 [Myxococcota bacterium]
MKATILSLAAILGVSACASSNVRRFPAESPAWRIDDRRPYETPPEGFYSPFIWDGANYSFFWRVSDALRFPVKHPAANVNSLDEVPNSSWYTNRLSLEPMSPEEVSRGACSDLDDDAGKPWTVVGGKPDGANPGFQIVNTEGVRALVKVDGTSQPERGSTADVIGAIIFHAAGYWVPCNRVTFVRKDQLTLKPGAKVVRTNGQESPLTQESIDEIMNKAIEVEPGLYRVSVSEFIEGKPIGPWRYEGRRKDDPNDSILHENRRELRAMQVFAGWFDHVDTRQENTLLAWMETGEELGFTRHYKIDFGDGFGIVAGPKGIPERLGKSGYLDLGKIGEDFISFGLIDRPWHDKELGKAGIALGYYSAEDYDPDPFVPGYPNPAFERATEQDLAWAARIMARFTPEHIEAMVERGRLRTVPYMEEEILRIMKARRIKVLERFLTKLSPLTWPEIRDDRLCLQDLALLSGIREPATRRYEVRGVAGKGSARRLEAALEANSWVCADISGFPSNQYTVVDFIASSEGRETTKPGRVHLAPVNGVRTIVGMERPSSREEPRL